MRDKSDSFPTGTVEPVRRVVSGLAASVLVALLATAAGRAGAQAPMAAAPAEQTAEAAAAKSAGCLSCHTQTDAPTMHVSSAVELGCADCHGGNPAVQLATGVAKGTEAYARTLDGAHVRPRFPQEWHYPSSANPQRTYTLLNRESREFIRFVNPSDYRVARESCGACHGDTIEQSVRSLHATGAMLWGGAAYNNGILPYKPTIMGESYTTDGQTASVLGPKIPAELLDFARDAGIVSQLFPLPSWETVKPGDIFRIFERGGRNIGNVFPETGLPDATGRLQRIEEPGRPDFRQSNRGPGTGARIAVPVINITKTRLNDPFLWFMGTNDQPGDYRQSGCAGCHVVYANDRSAAHSGPYAAFGHDGKSQTVDPTIPHDQPGHPLTHAFTRSIPTSQCMVCHMHQPNMFMNTYMGYTMWDYEADAPAMWPQKQRYPSIAETRATLDRNPEGASPRGKWGDVDFLGKVADLNPMLKDTEFADYHGHGWNFRAVFKRDRSGDLLDGDGKLVPEDSPDRNQRRVQLASIHMDKGMHCVDCHFSQDNHGNGYIYGEVAAAVEIDCKDCHGSVRTYPSLRTSGPAALGGGKDLSLMRTPDGRRRFEWINGELYQRSMLDPKVEWRVSLVKDSVTAGHPHYNERAARAKLMGKDTKTLAWGAGVPDAQLAHSDKSIECYGCHTSWTTSCAGCHLPIEANWKTARQHFEGGDTRNYATYNPQVARDDMFMLGHRDTAKGGKVAPVRSSSALVLSSTNANREHIYVQQPPIAASGFSSQAFNPHYPHTERTAETKTCDDCHLSKRNDNNAILAQLFLFGTNFVNFIGYDAYLGGQGEVAAVNVTEWDEPQAVIGSYLHKYAYPDWYAAHQARDKRLERGYEHDAGEVNCLQLRGEYLYASEGSRGMRVYDVASISNKGVSERVITAPFSPLGHDTHISSKDATCVALPTNQPINPARNADPKMRKDNLEAEMHPLYHYAYITDAKEGLILTDVGTLADGEPRNNFLKRAVTWNPNGVLNDARYITIGGYYLYISTPKSLVIVSVDQPLKPQLVATLPLDDPRGTALQFRYLFATTAHGLEVVDVTDPHAPRLVAGSTIALNEAHRVFLARTYAYVAAGRDGLVIVDAERPESLREYQRFNGQGAITDARDVVVGSTNASLFAYVADGAAGLKVVQLFSPGTQPRFYGFSPEPKPELIARYPTRHPALSLSKGLERDRGVDETGGQVAVFGRRGSGPLSAEETRRMYLDPDGKPWYVERDDAAASVAVRR